VNRACRFAVVPAAGAGERFGTAVPKQYADLAGAPVLSRTFDRLASLGCERTFVVLAPDDREYERRVGARNDVEILRCGDATRTATVRNALASLELRCNADDWVLVHDAVRPCVPRAALTRLMDELGDDPVGGLLAMPVADTLKRAQGDRVTSTENREALWQAQTPQMFRYAILKAALDRDPGAAFTDEAQAVEAFAATGACMRPRLVLGSPANLKITYPEDLSLAAAILATQS
jgi:2-C-methyl-D-erythritol 4-phosphate cytidylyltransferase